MLPNFQDLRSFLEVSSTKNLSRAAERLGITQPALSQAMKRLELCFDTDLLIRTKSGVQLTRAGKKIFIESRDLLYTWEQMVQETSKEQQTLKGRYILGIHSSIANYTVEFFLPQLLTEYKDLQLELVHDLSRKISEEIISFKIDFGLVVNPPPHPDLVITELFKDEVTYFTSKKMTPLNDLSSSLLTLIIEPSLTQTQEILNKSHKIGLKFKRTLSSSNLEVISKLVASGAGVGILPTRVAENAAQKLIKLPGSNPIFKDRICLVYRSEFRKSEAARELIQFVRNKLKS
jgi:LysR family transcriptional regulator, cell division regulator